MFGKMMNNYYYGKSGKGDFRKDDMPETRMQLFWDTLRTRLSSLCRLNLIYMLIWLPAMIVLLMNVSNLWNRVQTEAAISAYDYTEYAEMLQERERQINISEEEYNQLRATLQERDRIYNDSSYEAYLERIREEGGEALTEAEFLSVRTSAATGVTNGILRLLLILFPCIAITGPFTAGLSYVTRNWARDEHAFIWTDFKDAVKDNWKQALGVSAITAILPFVLYICYIFYNQMQLQSRFYLLPQMLTLVLGLLWYLGLVFMYPLLITYKMTFRELIRNGIMLAVARLPMTIGVRLATLMPAIIVLAVIFFTGAWLLPLMLLALYYIVLGNALARFVYASFTNGVFDRFINSKIEGVEINRGLAKEEDEDFTEEDEPQDEPPAAPQA